MILVFKKNYDGESLYDFDRDLSECIMAEYNPIIENIPTDEHGFHKGTFKVTIVWEPEGQDEAMGRSS